MLGKIISGVATVLTLTTAFVGKSYQDQSKAEAKTIKQLSKALSLSEKHNSTLTLKIDSIHKVVPIDTAGIWIRGYNQAKEDKACSYIYQDRNITITMGEGRCRYIYTHDVSSLKNERKTISGGGIIRDGSIYRK